MACKFTVQHSYNKMSIEIFNLRLPCIKMHHTFAATTLSLYKNICYNKRVVSLPKTSNGLLNGSITKAKDKIKIKPGFFSKTSSGSWPILAKLQKGGDCGEGNRTKSF